MDMMARVAWITRKTGDQGHGEWVAINVADAWAKHMNATCPDVHHWVEMKSNQEQAKQ